MHLRKKKTKPSKHVPTSEELIKPTNLTHPPQLTLQSPAYLGPSPPNPNPQNFQTQNPQTLLSPSQFKKKKAKTIPHKPNPNQTHLPQTHTKTSPNPQYQIPFITLTHRHSIPQNNTCTPNSTHRTHPKSTSERHFPPSRTTQTHVKSHPDNIRKGIQPNPPTRRFKKIRALFLETVKSNTQNPKPKIERE